MWTYLKQMNTEKRQPSLVRFRETQTPWFSITN